LFLLIIIIIIIVVVIIIIIIIIIISLKHPLDCIMTLTPHPFIGWSKQGRF